MVAVEPDNGARTGCCRLVACLVKPAVSTNQTICSTPTVPYLHTHEYAAVKYTDHFSKNRKSRDVSVREWMNEQILHCRSVHKTTSIENCQQITDGGVRILWKEPNRGHSESMLWGRQ